MKKLILTTALVMVSTMSFAEEAPAIGEFNFAGTENTYTQSDQGNTYHQSGSGNTTVNTPTPNGYVSNPGLTAGGTDVCLGSSSAGISAAGIGISGGSTTIDENCVMLRNAKLLASIGLKDAATVLLIISNEKIAESISLSNPDLFDALMGTGQ